MANTYAINVTRGKEFAVADELRALGLNPWVARRLDSKYIKEKKEWVFWDVPYLPKMVFCVFPAVSWSDVISIKDVIGRPMGFSDRAIRGRPAHDIQRKDGTTVHIPATYGLADFQGRVDAEYEDATAKRENIGYVCKYKVGQALEILKGGPFEGMQAEFSELVKGAHHEYAKLKVTVQGIGGAMDITISPDMVRAQ